MPVTIDQLFHRFLVNEKRKDFMKLFDKSSKELIEGNYNQFSNAQMMDLLKNLMKSAQSLVTAEDKVQRFRNHQNSLFLKLIEMNALQNNTRSTLCGSNLEDIDLNLDGDE